MYVRTVRTDRQASKQATSGSVLRPEIFKTLGACKSYESSYPVSEAVCWSAVLHHKGTTALWRKFYASIVISPWYYTSFFHLFLHSIQLIKMGIHVSEFCSFVSIVALATTLLVTNYYKQTQHTTTTQQWLLAGTRERERESVRMSVCACAWHVLSGPCAKWNKFWLLAIIPYTFFLQNLPELFQNRSNTVLDKVMASWLEPNPTITPTSRLILY